MRISDWSSDVCSSDLMPVDIAKRALQAAKLGGYDVLMLDTAGRLHIDETLMLEVAAVRDAVQPHKTLLVADALTGQDAVNVVKSFNERVSVTGIVLTRVDGDSRGGVALSMRRSEEHTSERQSLMRISDAVFCLT